jgi:hypothetical protein
MLPISDAINLSDVIDKFATMPKSKNPYKDILVIVLGFLVFFLIFKKTFLLYISGGVALAGVSSEFIAEKIVWGWYKLAEGLGYITSRILLSVIFFLFLTPLALLYRLFRKTDALQLKRKSSGSYFTVRNHLYVKEDLEKMW